MKFVWVLSLLLCSWVSFANDFCAGQLIEEKEGRYWVGKKPFLSLEDRSRLKNWFDEYFESEDPDDPETRVVSSGLRVMNPFTFGFEVRMRGEGEFALRMVESYGTEILSGYGDSDEELFYSFFYEAAERFLKSLVKTLPDPQAYFGGQEVHFLKVNTIRYFLEPRKINPNLPPHRDGVEYQGILVLKRPRLMEGGTLVLESYPTSKTTADILGPNENRLVLFDGRNLWHGVSAFDLTKRSRGNFGPFIVRDVLSFFLNYDSAHRGYRE